MWVFGGLVAAALPMAVGGFAIFGSMAVLRAIAFATDVSIFALNLSRRDGHGVGDRLHAADRQPVPRRACQRCRARRGPGARDGHRGRTVLFSAATVAMSMSAMVLFPMYFLKSFAYAGIAAVAFVAVAAIVVTPAVIALLGERLDSLDVRRLVRRAAAAAGTRPPPGRADILLPLSQIRDAPRHSDRARGCRAAGRARRAVLRAPNGACPTIACYRHRPRRARSAISCAPISLTTWRRT